MRPDIASRGYIRYDGVFKKTSFLSLDGGMCRRCTPRFFQRLSLEPLTTLITRHTELSTREVAYRIKTFLNSNDIAYEELTQYLENLEKSFPFGKRVFCRLSGSLNAYRALTRIMKLYPNTIQPIHWFERRVTKILAYCSNNIVTMTV
jgi:hypothetical protein